MPPQEIRPGVFLLQVGSTQHAVAMKVWEWGKPRGYCITWRTATNKPHLYRVREHQ